MLTTPVGSSPVHGLERVPRSETELLSMLENVWGYVRKGRIRFDYRIQELRYFLAGDQWIRFDALSQRFGRHALDDWVPTPVTNLMIQHYDYLSEVFTAGDPFPAVDPATREIADVEAARAAERVLQSEFLRMGSGIDLIHQAASWLVMTGNCILSSYWNAHSKERMRVERKRLAESPMMQESATCRECGYQEPAINGRERCPQCQIGVMVVDEGPGMGLYGPDGNPLMEAKEELEKDENGNTLYDEVQVGNIEERVVNLLNFYPQPCASMKKCRYVLETQPMDLDEIKDVFGSKARDQAAESLEFQEWDTPYASDTPAAGFVPSEKESHRDKALVKFLRHIPDHRFKDGMLLIGTRDKVYYRGKIDSPNGELGYTHIKYRDIPGIFWGTGPIADILPQQKRINAIDSSIVQNRKQMVSNQWLVPDGSGVSTVDGRSGLVIRWSPMTSGGFKPERLPGVPLPGQVLQEKSGEIGAMQQVSGVSDILSGQMPQGASSLETGAAIENLYEAAYKRFRKAGDRWREGLAEHFHRNLVLASVYWDDERLVRVQGEGRDLETYYYRGADLRRAQDMTVRVSLGTKPSTVSYQRKIMDAAKVGLLGDIRDPAVRGRILEQMEIEGFEEEYVADARKARRVLRSLRDGEEPPPPLPTDNPAIQFKVLREFTLTPEFERLDPGIQQAILQRAMAYQQQMQQSQQQAMAAAQAAKGTDKGTSAALSATGAMGQGQVPTTGPGG